MSAYYHCHHIPFQLIDGGHRFFSMPALLALLSDEQVKGLGDENEVVEAFEERDDEKISCLVRLGDLYIVD